MWVRCSHKGREGLHHGVTMTAAWVVLSPQYPQGRVWWPGQPEPLTLEGAIGRWYSRASGRRWLRQMVGTAMAINPRRGTLVESVGVMPRSSSG